MTDWQWIRGEYETWAEASRASRGYDDPRILHRVIASTRRVKSGLAAFERDGVAFDRPFQHRQLLSALFEAASVRGGRLRVLDFGGALGSAYWQHREQLQELAELDWLVVEQPHFVEAGNREFSTRELRFTDSLPAMGDDPVPDILLASSSLQYVSVPWDVLARLLAIGASRVLLDRIPLLVSAGDRLCVEHVPPELGETSYPVWFLGRERLLRMVQERYELVQTFRTILQDGIPETWHAFGQTIPNCGFLFRARLTRD